LTSRLSPQDERAARTTVPARVARAPGRPRPAHSG
jgi:hypothetical protein